MKIRYLLWLLFLSATFSYGQAENNHWILGYSDLNFAGNPGTASTISNLNQYGCANASDASGNLLFYTDGIEVFRSNHQIMPNGPIGYHASNAYLLPQAQPALIVPYPGNPQKYFVFSTCSSYGTYYVSGPQYQVYLVDLANTTSPLGTGAPVYIHGTSGSPSVTPNVTFRPMACIRNAAGTGYHVFVADLQNIFRIDITSAGISLPITTVMNWYSALNIPLTSAANYPYHFCTFKFSPNEQKLGCLVRSQYSATTSTSKFYTLDYNSSTASLSNFTLIDSNTSNASTDFEFSGDSQKVFQTRDYIYVKDLASPATAPRQINETGKTDIPLDYHHLQRDMYGNILISSVSATNNRNKYLHKIENQNSFTTSSVTSNSITLNNNAIPDAFNWYGLTVYHFYPLPTPIATLEEPCQALTLTSEPNSSTHVYQNKTSITCQINYSISSSAQDITMKAQDFVVLKPNTLIKSGKFLAKIQACSGMSARVENTIAEEPKPQDPKSGLGLAFFPNPTSGILGIRTENLEMIAVDISSMMDSRSVGKYKVEKSDTFTTDISHLNKGLYLVTVQTSDGKILTGKVIKQ